MKIAEFMKVVVHFLEIFLLNLTMKLQFGIISDLRDLLKTKFRQNFENSVLYRYNRYYINIQIISE